MLSLGGSSYHLLTILLVNIYIYMYIYYIYIYISLIIIIIIICVGIPIGILQVVICHHSMYQLVLQYVRCNSLNECSVFIIQQVRLEHTEDSGYEWGTSHCYIEEVGRINR